MSDNPMEQKPRKVQRAEFFLLAFVVGLFIKIMLKLVVPLMQAGILHMMVLQVAIQFLSLVPWIFLVYFIMKGRNWARISFLILFALELLWLIVVIMQLPANNWLTLDIYATPTLLGIAACVYLLFGETSAWFQAVKAHRKLGRQDLQPAVPEDETARGSERPVAVSDEEPLFVLKYDGLKHAVRIGFLCFWVAIFGFVAYAASAMDVSELAVLIVRGLAGAAFIWSILLLIETLLFKEIRLFKDRMVKIRKLFGPREIGLANARCVGRSRALGTPRCLFNHGSSSWFGRINGINYDEDLVAAQDVAKMNGLLADLTGRKTQDFAGVSIDLNRLIETRPTVNP